MKPTRTTASPRSRRARRRLTLVTFAVVLMVAGAALAAVAVGARQQAPIAPPPSPPRELEQITGTARAPGSRPKSTPAKAALTMARSTPISIAIPSIGVRSRIDALGLESDGTLEVPSGERYDDVGWYRHSPTPGAMGPAVLLGHVDSKARGASIFHRLGEIQPGARIEVVRADRTIATFEVDRVRTYPKRAFPTATVYGDIDHAGLRLLTCGGVFDDSAGSYVDNVVVFASLVAGPPRMPRLDRRAFNEERTR